MQSSFIQIGTVFLNINHIVSGGWQSDDEGKAIGYALILSTGEEMHFCTALGLEVENTLRQLVISYISVE